MRLFRKCGSRFAFLWPSVYECAYTHFSFFENTGISLLEIEMQPLRLFVICFFSHTYYYGVASISRLLKMIGLFCRISSLLQGAFAKEAYHFKEPTNRSHPIPRCHFVVIGLYSHTCIFSICVCKYMCFLLKNYFYSHSCIFSRGNACIYIHIYIIRLQPHTCQDIYMYIHIHISTFPFFFWMVSKRKREMCICMYIY